MDEGVSELEEPKVRFGSVGCLSEDGGLQEIFADGQDEGFRKFNNFQSNLIAAKNLVVLAGSGTSLTLNSVTGSNIAPSMADFWDACRSGNTELFDEVIAILGDALPKDNGIAVPNIESLLSMVEMKLQLVDPKSQEGTTLSKFLQISRSVISTKASFTKQSPEGSLV